MGCGASTQVLPNGDAYAQQANGEGTQKLTNGHGTSTGWFGSLVNSSPKKGTLEKADNTPNLFKALGFAGLDADGNIRAVSGAQFAAPCGCKKCDAPHMQPVLRIAQCTVPCP